MSYYLGEKNSKYQTVYDYKPKVKIKNTYVEDVQKKLLKKLSKVDFLKMRPQDKALLKTKLQNKIKKLGDGGNGDQVYSTKIIYSMPAEKANLGFLVPKGNTIKLPLPVVNEMSKHSKVFIYSIVNKKWEKI